MTRRRSSGRRNPPRAMVIHRLYFSIGRHAATGVRLNRDWTSANLPTTQSSIRLVYHESRRIRNATSARRPLRRPEATLLPLTFALPPPMFRAPPAEDAMATRDIKNRDERHPEKAHRPDAPILRKPDWIRVKAPTSEGYKNTRDILREQPPGDGLRGGGLPERRRVLEPGPRHHDDHGRDLHPRLHLLQRRDRAAGRARRRSSRGGSPRRSASSGLNHVVVTSVDRDDLDDGGAEHFAADDPRDPRARARHDDRGADAGFPEVRAVRAGNGGGGASPTSSTTTSRRCPASTPRCAPARATSPRCACCSG